MSQAPHPDAVRSSVEAAINPALAGEHAALYAYGVIGARLDRTERRLAAAAAERHRRWRDELSGAVTAAGGSPAVAEPAYRLPFPVDNRSDACRLAILVEDRLSALYLALVVATVDGALRSVGARALQSSASEAALWRIRAGVEAVMVAFPGR